MTPLEKIPLIIITEKRYFINNYEPGKL